ncbi:MAG: DEAD/DEAH box helicase family protein, partial [bacterium]
TRTYSISTAPLVRVRFAPLYAIYDHERSLAITDNEYNAKAFADSQLILCATEFLADNATRAWEARSAGFDLLIVDEAHHLEWSAEESSTAYQVVESISNVIPSLILLTATPQRLGAEGHFARLRLL